MAAKIGNQIAKLIIGDLFHRFDQRLAIFRIGDGG